MEDDALDRNNLGRWFGLAPPGDEACSPVSLSFSFPRSRLILFFNENPFFSFSCPGPILLGDRPNDPKTERGGDAELGEPIPDGDDGADSGLLSALDHRARSEDVRRLIDEDTFTSPVLALTGAEDDADGVCDGVCDTVDGGRGGGDGRGMGGNVQCEGKDELGAAETTSDSICRICSVVNIGFPRVYLSSFCENFWRFPSISVFFLEARCWSTDAE